VQFTRNRILSKTLCEQVFSCGASSLETKSDIFVNKSLYNTRL